MSSCERESLLAVPQAVQLLDTLGLVLEPGSAALASGPVASGWRRYAMPDADAGIVRKANIKELEDFASRLRLQLDCPVICPGGLHVPHWRGRDYERFFRAVMDRFVQQVRFMDGWEYSTGSVLELAYCLRTDRPAFDAFGVPFDIDTSVTRVEAALKKLSVMGEDADNLRNAFSALCEAV